MIWPAEVQEVVQSNLHSRCQTHVSAADFGKGGDNLPDRDSIGTEAISCPSLIISSSKGHRVQMTSS